MNPILSIVIGILIVIDIVVLFGGWYYINKNSYNYGADFNKWKPILILIAVCLVILLILLAILFIA